MRTIDHRSHAFFALCLLAHVLVSICADDAHSKHTRVYISILADNTPGNFLGASSLGSGIWMSDDTGRSWSQLGWKHGKTYSLDILSGSNGNTLYIARGDGLLRTTDGGNTWKMMTDWRQTEVMDVALDQHDHRYIYLATAHGIWRSDDTGTSWKMMNKGLPYPFVSGVKINPMFPNRLAASTEKGLYVSFDKATSWRRVIFDSSASRAVFFNKEGRMYWGDNDGMVRSERAETIRNGDLLGNVWAITSSNRSFYTGGNKGVFHISDSVVFTPLPGSPPTVNALHIVGNTLFIGSLDKGLWCYTINAPQSICQPLAFPNGEIYTIKSIEIQ